MANTPLGFPFGFYVSDNTPLDGKYGIIDTGAWRPYVDEAEANAEIPSGARYLGLTVNIANEEYWYKDGIADVDLVAKGGGGGGGGWPLTGEEAITGDVAMTAGGLYSVRLGTDILSNIGEEIVTFQVFTKDGSTRLETTNTDYTTTAAVATSTAVEGFLLHYEDDTFMISTLSQFSAAPYQVSMTVDHDSSAKSLGFDGYADASEHFLRMHTTTPSNLSEIHLRPEDIRFSTWDFSSEVPQMMLTEEGLFFDKPDSSDYFWLQAGVVGGSALPDQFTSSFLFSIDPDENYYGGYHEIRHRYFDTGANTTEESQFYGYPDEMNFSVARTDHTDGNSPFAAYLQFTLDYLKFYFQTMTDTPNESKYRVFDANPLFIEMRYEFHDLDDSMNDFNRSIRVNDDAVFILNADTVHEDLGTGPVVKSPDGDYWRIDVSNAGVVSATNIGATYP
jgi:hypothetical protein